MVMTGEWALRPIGNLEAYVATVMNMPMLTEEEETQYIQKFRAENDMESAYKLVLSHLKFVVSIARQYMGYGLPQADLIQEGNIGLMEAVNKFDPERANNRFANYAVYLIRFRIHEYVIKNWRIVKIATTKAQRKLFFNLRSMRRSLGPSMPPEEIARIAGELDVSPEDVMEMEQRFNGGDTPLQTFMSENEDSIGPQDVLFNADDEPVAVLRTHQRMVLSDAVQKAIEALDDRDRRIIKARWVDVDDNGIGATLGELAQEFGISGERVRQLETKALKKLRAALAEKKGFFE